MKYTVCIVAMLALAACNNSGEEKKLKAMVTQDSLMAANSQKKDSTITSYISALNEIQDNLDSIKSKERIVSIKTEGGEPLGSNTVADIRSLDKLIIRNNREVYRLESRLKKMSKKDAALEKMVAHLTKELGEKNAEIASLQAKLAEANNSLVVLTRQFNDSVAVINRQRSEINAMRNEVNMVYYAIGTVKDLKEKGLIDKKGGLLGIGRTAELSSNVNMASFTEGNMTKLLVLPLDGKFGKLITNHPNDSYKITGTGKSDSLVITNTPAFWSESKYLVISIK